MTPGERCRLVARRANPALVSLGYEPLSPADTWEEVVLRMSEALERMYADLQSPQPNPNGDDLG